MRTTSSRAVHLTAFHVQPVPTALERLTEFCRAQGEEVAPYLVVCALWGFVLWTALIIWSST